MQQVHFAVCESFKPTPSTIRRRRARDALLDTYRTLTEWSTAVQAPAPTSSSRSGSIPPMQVERDGVTYEFTKDSQAPWLSTKAAPAEFVAAIARHSPDVVHVNGLIFPQLVAAIRKAVGPRTAIVVQHHGGEFPIRGSGLVGLWQRMQWRGGLSAADAISFTAREQAEPWRAAEVLGAQRILEIVESGTTMRQVDRDRARTAIGIDGDAAHPVGRPADDQQGSTLGARWSRAGIARTARRARGDGVRRRHLDCRQSKSAFAPRRSCAIESRLPAASLATSCQITTRRPTSSSAAAMPKAAATP